jgi:hypothetical protein
MKMKFDVKDADVVSYDLTTEEIRELGYPIMTEGWEHV